MSNEEDIRKALDVARSLIKAGVPVFAASPCPEDCPGVKRTKNRDGTWTETPHKGGPGQYHLPREWEKTVATERYLDPNDQIGWKPGWALAAVGGHAVDFLDNDPRNGGAESLKELIAAGDMPFILGQQKTPSGGEHYVIHPTGERKSTMFMPGLDLQSGGTEGPSAGIGRGFVFIAPTVRRSKDPKDAGALRAYEWTDPPEVELFGDFEPGADPSLAGLIARVHAKKAARAEPRERAQTPEFTGGLADVFLSPGQAAGLAFGGERSFTLAAAQDFVRPALLDLQQAPVGMIEETANIAAATLSHFVPAFWNADQAFALLEHSLSLTAYDPNGPSDWTAEKFREVLDGRRPPLDRWVALRAPDPAVTPAVTVEAAPGEEALSTLEKLRRKLVSASDLASRKPPRPLVHGLLNLNTESWMIGAPGSLKSFVALDIAGHVARGVAWQGLRVEKHNVLYLAAEGEEGMILRTRAWIKRHGDMEGVTFLPYPVQVKSSDGQWDALVQIASELRPGLIIIDTQHRVSVGLEENSATDMGVLISAIGRLRRATGACELVIHHTGRDGGNARGSSALDGAQDTELHIKRSDPRETLMCKIIQDKQKDMAEAGGKDGLTVQFEIVDLGVDEETGRELSSLVMRTDLDTMHAEMIARSGFTEADVEPWKGKAPEGWTAQVPGVPANATLKRRIIQVLADHAHDRGLTQAEARRAVIARWYEGGKAPAHDSWTDGWSFVTSLDVATAIGGERWALDQAELSRLKALDPFA